LGVALIWFYYRIGGSKIMGKTIALNLECEYNIYKQKYAWNR
jgi:hypothetical protein